MTPSSPLELKIKPLYYVMEMESRKGNLDRAINYANEALGIVPQDVNLIKQRRSLIDSVSIKKAYEAIFELREELYNTGELEKFINLIAVVPKTILERPEIKQIMTDLRAEWELYKNRKSTKLSGPKNICIYVGPGYENWSPETVKTKGSGGSEEMCVRMAKALKELGNKVTVYNQFGDAIEGEFDGVKYIDFRKFRLEDEWDVLIVERVPGMFMNRLNAKKQYLWLHDTHYGELPRKLFALPDKIFALSEAHKAVLQDFYGNLEDDRFC
jgi:tetratricopeptide (TPR) repeat protein